MADSPVLYVYYRPDNDDAYPGVPARHITEADWARFSLSQRRTVENATTQEGYTRRKVWVHRDLVDETEQERADREAREQAAREAYERGQSIVRWRDFEPLVPGPGEVIVGTESGAVAVPGHVDPARTLSVIGDLHIGYGANDDERSAQKANIDAVVSDVPAIANLYQQRIYIGDQVDMPGTTGTTPGANDLAFFALANALDDDWLAVAGNHDISTSRTAEHWAQVYGHEGANWTRDMGAFRLIAVASDGPGHSSTLSASTLTFLDNELRASRKDTVILCHFPLFGTSGVYVNESGTWEGMSTFGPRLTGSGHVQPDTDVRTILDRHPHARVWVAGHAHPTLNSPDLFKQEWVGSRYIAHINAGAPTARAGARPWSPLITMLPDRVQVRMRDHTARAWATYRGQAVYEMAWGEADDIVTDRMNPASVVLPVEDSLTGESRRGAVAATVTAGTVTYTTVNGENGASLGDGNTATIDMGQHLYPDRGSVVLRVALTAGTSGVRVFHHRPTTDDLMHIERVSAGNIRLYTGTGLSINTQATMTDDNIHTIGVSWKDGVTKVYIDGQLDTMSTQQNFVSAWGTATIGYNAAYTLFGLYAAHRDLTQDEHDRLHEAPVWTWDSLA